MEEKTLTFDEKLSKLLELAKSKKNVLDEKEVLDAFASGFYKFPCPFHDCG